MHGVANRNLCAMSNMVQWWCPSFLIKITDAERVLIIEQQSCPSDDSVIQAWLTFSVIKLLISIPLTDISMLKNNFHLKCQSVMFHAICIFRAWFYCPSAYLHVEKKLISKLKLKLFMTLWKWPKSDPRRGRRRFLKTFHLPPFYDFTFKWINLKNGFLSHSLERLEKLFCEIHPSSLP